MASLLLVPTLFNAYPLTRTEVPPSDEKPLVNKSYYSVGGNYRFPDTAGFPRASLCTSRITERGNSGGVRREYEACETGLCVLVIIRRIGVHKSKSLGSMEQSDHCRE